jgi:hypothetical protein
MTGISAEDVPLLRKPFRSCRGEVALKEDKRRDYDEDMM